MVLASFAAGALAANCYVLSAADDRSCVVIDPGMDAVAALDRLLDEHHLIPSLVLLTHGHFDHVASAAAVADRYDAACYIGPGDRALLADPLAGLTSDLAPLVTDYLRGEPAMQPRRLVRLEREPDGRSRLHAAGLTFDLIAAPGHTPGSTLFLTSLPTTSCPEAGTQYDLVFTGDVLFEGTIGRTDLPGGDPHAMNRTLTSTVLSLADETVVLPGHGRRTTIGRERTTNPFLRRLG
ncbi:MBL fold metallo-hydrolase [Microlunatus sp. Gsoil 973]|uniref:MBL fold metallo-hydrolase n=1 Tax=Microlunatus sp. Gsoil 973 TaxID=2672569 RepID=UPI0012B4C333|nr:MBL fold metallo-hydrolase [Microlunatus sp. Gsoil 973]QGN32698.1 MBL fold metallo-hydrolase [Microlunatus sp. Gsoil 973]